ncbi:cysteine desulfurase family protein [Acuticoccus sp. I52.16.1]|uniref:cysteine desulfurase family protein n=1 Tax=Acuticoccus sp. I52.16.1 TaxID=2928472 RepID=UPI001FD56E08|nr:aminotransferase class V-fold PLP-dependent enzyme [Acuticoccus sp. I52.16.1]UOM34546.1 aminotransferase class V-fold PLP-dependent enzyme [Acuticoccus sp. I52.16.1]
MAERLYLDWNASAPTLAAARDAAIAALLAGGNASSVHAEGRASRGIVETARRALGARFAVSHEGVTFTSGGTEANAMALRPGVARDGGPPVERLVTAATEHPAVLAGGGFAPADVTILPVDALGRVAPEALAAALADPRPALVSLMAANNETGVVTNPALFELARGAGAVTHTDAVQAFGRVEDATLTADLVTVSGHKLGAPPGVGALIRRGVGVPALIKGGGQERGARGGTENVPAIAGLAAALAGPAADPHAWEETRTARDNFETALLEKFPKVTIFGRAAPRLPNTSLIALGAPAELALIGLDLAGVAVSSGAACSSGKVSVSHVLVAMGVPDALARCAIRVSAGPMGAARAFERFLVALDEVIVPMTR